MQKYPQKRIWQGKKLGIVTLLPLQGALRLAELPRVLP